MDKVCVLISTYNGEEFIRDQINSVLAQKDVEIKIFIRDDGSTDNTVNIIKEFTNNFDNIKFYQGTNLGAARSFLDLVSKSEESDFYAFCDQDDVWDSDKLAIAISQIKDLNSEEPNTYYSNLRIVDEELRFFRNSHSSERSSIQDSKYSCFIENMATGCTMVFNKTARNMLIKHPPKEIYMHDGWLYIICKIFGNTVYDFNPHISYRQHSNNVVGTYLKHRSLKTNLKRVIKLFTNNSQPRYVMTKSFYEAFKDELSDEDKKVINVFLRYKESFFRKLQLITDSKFKASSFLNECRINILILKGKL